MAGSVRIFKNIDQMKLSTKNLAIVFLALLGSLASLAAYKWLDQATSQEVNLVPSVTSCGEINGCPPSPIGPGPKRLDVDVVLVVDWSGSMNGASGSDPEGLRLRASEILASSLAADIFPRHTRMGYVPFAKTAIVIQDLVDVEGQDTRGDLIQKIYLPPEPSNVGDWTTLTNVSDAFLTAGNMLDNAKLESDPKFSTNIPAIIFLTDGRPTNGVTSDERLGEIVNTLLENKTLIFTVILRNPNNPDPDLGVGPSPDPTLTFSFWRKFWFDFSKQYPNQVKYFEAEDDTQLEGIYNTIRSRLVREGTKPSERLEYDPSDTGAAIEVPPGLLQAHILVNRPIGVNSIELIAPDGLNFQEDILRDPDNNEILEGNYFYRFSIYKPIPGKWKLQTDAQQPLYYLLLTESIYTIKPILPSEALYLAPERPTDLYFGVFDDKNDLVSDKSFNISASTVETVQDGDSYVENTVILSDLKPTNVNKQVQYLLTITPEMFGEKEKLQIQIDGTSDDGSLVNLTYYDIPVLSDSSEFTISMPDVVICNSDELVFWPPTIQCNNQIPINVKLTNAGLISEGSLTGKLYTPLDDEIQMNITTPSSLDAEISPVTQVGTYQVIVDLNGKIITPDDELQWIRRSQKTFRVEWPAWTETAKHRTWFAFVILLVIALWKPVIVAVLLPLFAILRVAPSGFYMDSENGTNKIYDLAMKKRSLFAITIAFSKNADINLYSDFEDNVEGSFSSKFSGRIQRRIYRWLKNATCARIVAVPWNGIWVEKPSGEFERASENRFTTVNCQNANLKIGQRDWEDEDFLINN
jgi:uncharacterized protein YegL